MSTIASGMFYLASPLAVAGHPAATAPDALRTPAVATPSVAEAGSRGSPDRGYIIVDLPKISRPGGKSLDEVIGEEVRRRISEHPDGTPGMLSIVLADGIGPGDDAAPAPGDLDHAVIAAHEERIALLKQRLGALRSGDAAAPLLEDLRGRLRRAEAARRLAVARAAGAVPPLAAPQAVASNDIAPPARTIAGRTRAASAAGHAARALTAGARRGGSAGHLFAAGAKRDPQGLTRAAAAAGPYHAAHATMAVAGPPLAQRDGAGRSAALRLAQARRSLAVARGLLEAGGPGTPPPHVEPVIQLAGLWRWPGSDSWSLADYRAGLA